MGRARRKRDYVVCVISSFIGTLLLGSLFILAASIAISLVKGLTLSLAIAAILFGILTILTASESCPLPGREMRGIISSGLPIACLGFGLTSLQCSLPLLAGYIALISSTGSVTLGLIGLSLLALGMAISLSVALYLAGKASSAFSNVLKDSLMLERIGGGILIALGVYLILSV